MFRPGNRPLEVVRIDNTAARGGTLRQHLIQAGDALFPQLSDVSAGVPWERAALVGRITALPLLQLMQRGSQLDAVVIRDQRRQPVDKHSHSA